MHSKQFIEYNASIKMYRIQYIQDIEYIQYIQCEEHND